MPTDLDEVDVWNQALDLLKEAPFRSTTDNTSVSRWFERNYATIRDAVTRAYPWNFARARASLTADATAPDFGWAYRFALPADCLRPMPLTVDGEWEGQPIQHEVEGGYILTDDPGPVYLRYIAQKTDPADWEPLFVRALAGALAAQAAHWMTGKASFVQIADAQYQGALREARRIDASEGTMERAYDSDVISARYS